ncbi:MAG: chromate transporter [Clostridiales bacterium]|nr:chromate transporter [Clostridiales bacterium]
MKNQIQEKSEKKWKGGLLELFWSFFKIGLFTFGGGYAMIPLIQKEAVESKKWISDDDILEIIAIAESTPGPIAINSATFVGYRVRGFWGSFFATLGVVMPSFLIILTIAFVLKEFQSIAVVKYAFWGIRAGVLALIFKAVVNMYKKSKKNLFSHIVMFSAFFIVAFFNVNVIFVIIGCALAGLISALVAERRAKK